VAATAGLMLAVVGVGHAVRPVVLRHVDVPLATRLAVLLAAGLATCSLLVLALGHAHLLRPWVPWTLAAAGTGLLVLRRQQVGVEARALSAGLRRALRRRPVLTAAPLVVLALAGIAALGPSWANDERAYHWAGPLEWAAAGGWTDASVRLVDGPALMHWLYTAAALVPANAASHMLHLLTLVMAALAAAGMAASFGVDGVPWAAATVAVPAALNTAWVTSNDVAVAGFGLTAGAVLVAGATSRADDGTARAAGLVAAAASATKAFGAGVLAPLLVLHLGLRGRAALRSRRAAHDVLWLVVPSVLVLGLLLARAWWMTGSAIDPAGSYLARDPNDPLLLSGAAAGRFPTLLDVLVHPVVPFALPLLGQAEPWGGRTGYVLLALVPALAWSVWCGGLLRRRALVLLGAAAAGWMTWGIVLVKTRFHLLEWVLLAGVVVLALAECEQQRPRWRPWLRAAFAGLVLAGLLDSGRYIAEGLGRLAG
jgi:hypothetical protein